MESMYLIFIVLATLFLAYSNGANDNFKGVATLYGSKTVDYKKALAWTSVTTLLGSIAALYLSSELIIAFKGKGIVPNEVIQMDSFPFAVGVGAALTVILATFLKLPVSTTHALVGALAGAGWMIAENQLNWTKLSSKFFLPLVGGPIISLGLTCLVYPFFKKLRGKLKIHQESCLCVGKRILGSIPSHVSSKDEFIAQYSSQASLPEIIFDDNSYCRQTYSGSVIGISSRTVIDTLHYISSGIVCFARGLNDTPKIAALLLIGSRFDINIAIALVALFILVGGLVHSRRIAETMGDKLTEMNSGQAFTANLVTGIMVLGASRVGIPVSTTHVSCGSIFGIGAVNKDINTNIVGQIILAWVTTLPIGFFMGAIFMRMLN